jgi:hypothetical protein
MASMRVNISKSKFFAEQIEYLGYWITRKGIQPINNKVEAILNIKAPKTRKKTEIRKFTGIVNYYCSMFLACFQWISSHQARSSLNGTHPINRPSIKLRNSLELRCGVLLCYPDFKKPNFFHLYTDASDHQLGAVIMQHKKPIAFYSRKLNTAQYSSKAVYNHWDRQRVVISYWNLQGIQDYPVTLPHDCLYII